MPIVTVHTAKTTLSALLKRAEAGEEIIIARGNVPVARLVPLHAAAPKRQFGAMRGEVVVPASFFDPLPADELAGWE